MPLAITCAGCKRRLRVADAQVGKAIKCPQCAHKMVVKRPATPPAARPPAQVKAPASKPGAGKNTAVTAGKVKPGKSSTAVSQVPAQPAASVRKRPAPAAEEQPESDSSPSSSDTAPSSGGKQASSRPAAKSAKGMSISTLVLILLVGVGGAVGGWFAIGSLRGDPLCEVSGKVTLAGEALVGAKLAFISDEEGQPREFTILTDHTGHYKFAATLGRALPPGRYKVTISKLALRDGNVPAGEEFERARKAGRLREVVPAVYTSTKSTFLLAELQRGDNALDFRLELPPEPPPPP